MTAPDVHAAPGPRLLVAEDHPVACRVAVAMLERLGCDVTAVGTGNAAVDACAAGSFDLVLMDCEMPGMDGYEATRRIREAEAPRHTPIVALSAHSLAEHRRRSLEAGMDDHVVKPFTLAGLRGLLEHWVGRPADAGGAAPEEGPLEESVLRELRAFNARLAEQTAEQFLVSSERAVAALAAAQQAGAMDEAAAAAHGLVGSAGLVGARGLRAAARVAEDAARARALSPAQVAAVRSEQARARRALATDYPSLLAGANS